MVVTDLDMVNRACARIGTEPLLSMTESTHGGEAAQLTYDSTVEFLLGNYPFSFAKVFKQLNRDTDAPPFSGYAYRFTLYPERLGPPIKVRQSLTDEDDRFSDYIVNGDKIHSNAETLYGEFLHAAPPHHWTGPFREAFVLALASRLALALRQDEKLSAEIYAQAFGHANEAMRGGAYGAAIRADSFATPAKTLRQTGNPLTRHFRHG